MPNDPKEYTDSSISNQVDLAKTEYYATFQDPTVPGTIDKFQNGEIPYLTIPPRYQNSQQLWDIVLTRYTTDTSLLSRHAEMGHPADSILAVKLLLQEVRNSNVTMNIRPSGEIREGKEAELSRLVLQTPEPIERDVTRYLHLEMALELANQVSTGKAPVEAVKKHLRKFAQSNPGFAVLVASELVALAPITRDFSFDVDDIFDVMPNMTFNRESDRRFLSDMYYALAGKKVFTKDELEKAMQLVARKHPEEALDLKKSGTFKEKVKPIAVFESSFNILVRDLFPRKGIRVEPFVMSRIGELADSVTSSIVTAYVQHTPTRSLGQSSIMLSPETLKKFN